MFSLYQKGFFGSKNNYLMMSVAYNFALSLSLNTTFHRLCSSPLLIPKG